MNRKGWPRLQLDERSEWLASMGLVVAAAVLVYLNTLGNDFAYDDIWIIRDRDVVQDLGQLWRILSVEYWPEIFRSGLYRPLLLLSFAIEWQLWDGKPLGFHLVNVLLHAVVSGLVFVFLSRFFPRWSSLLGALVFAVHPVHTEAVANVVGRGEVLSAVWVLWAALVYTRATRGDGLKPGSILGVTLLYALAGLTKEGGIVLPGLLLATDLPLIARREAGSFRDLARSRAPLLAAMTVVLVLILLARQAVLGVAVESVPDPIFALDSSFPTRFFTMARVWPRYLELLLVPLELSADYGPAIILPVTTLTPLGLAGILAVLALVGSAVLFFRRAPEYAMALAWFAVAMAPVSNMIITAEIVLAERTLYLSSLAFSIILALMVARARPAPRRWLVAAILLWVAGFSVVTVRRNPVWYSTDTVFEDLRRKHPESVRLLMGVATQLERRGEWETARVWYYRAMEIWPYHGSYNVEFAFRLYRHGEYEEAAELVARAIGYRPTERTWHRFFVAILVRLEDWDAVLEAVRDARQNVAPEEFFDRMEAKALAGLERFDEAVAAQQSAVRKLGEDATWETRLDLAQLWILAGDTAAALAEVTRAREAAGAPPALADSLARVWSGVR
jgi:tetratricopeptide (TPR) repeat protein